MAGIDGVVRTEGSVLKGNAPTMETRLTGFDYILGNTPVRRVLYYDKPLNIELLKAGLRETLAYYPTMQGRIKRIPDGLAVFADNQGIVFIDVESSACMPEIGLHAPEHDTSLYAPEFDLPAILKGEEPMFKIQVTNFSNGCILGLSTTHLLVDGGTFWNFVEDWARLMNGESVTELPAMNRDLIFEQASGDGSQPSTSMKLKKMNLAAKLKLIWQLIIGPKKNAAAMWYFDEECIAALKTYSEEQQLSRFDLMGAMLFKLLANEIDSGDDIQVGSIYNLRLLSALPIPTTYIGNALATIPKLFKKQDLRQATIGSIAQQIRSSKSTITTEGLQQDLAYYQRQVREGKLSKEGRITAISEVMFATMGGNAYPYNIWAFPIYNFTIQGNTAVWYDFVASSIFKIMNLIIVMPAPQGGLLVKVLTRKDRINALARELGIVNKRPDINVLRNLN
ncbi:hypothetical protein G8764_04465 [Pseudomaricurvus alcaniphilus]|uniref:acyltransferase n=1 Tax=Pseudomaricurvus alcaniphilus TaxID=1166482 RepID=UPI00140DB7B3|nr:acyltransferase [Pseudomaricurvus alcaniphilus]NHN36542.1 hypothetical protein [Pseudomaricurvus alcaniphilus]